MSRPVADHAESDDRGGLRARFFRSGRGVALGAIVVTLSGVALLIATYAAGLGHAGFLSALALIALGLVVMIALLVREGVRAAVAGLSAVAVAVLGAVVVMDDRHPEMATWEDVASSFFGTESARVGDVFILDGVARDITTGEVVWDMQDRSPEIAMVDEDIVVLGTDEGLVTVDPRDGAELWNSPVSGVGVAHDGETLVVSVRHGEDDHSAVALDLTDGEVSWEQDGSPVMECRLDPVNLPGPAVEQTAVIIDGPGPQANLVGVSDGETALADIGCGLFARVIDGVLVEHIGSGEVSGRSIDTGETLWRTVESEPRKLQGGERSLFSVRHDDVREIDGKTGDATYHRVPDQVRSVELPRGSQRAAGVWLLVATDSGPGVWNPGIDELVIVPEASQLSASVHSLDARSGWVSLSGVTQDATGEERSQCWAVSPDGTLHGPARDGDRPWERCQVVQGLMSTSHGYFPVG